jgi:hypothetical protein
MIPSPAPTLSYIDVFIGPYTELVNTRGRMRMVQIGGYLQPDEHASFKTYANDLGLTESALAKLLLVRELRRKCLNELKGKYPPGARSGSRKRVTAHRPDAAMKTAFSERCSEEGLKPDQAASILYRAELDERWLDKAMTT